MIIAVLVIGIVVSMPIVAAVVVSVASRREEAALSLRGPAPGVVQAAARRILDFHSEDPGWVLPKNCDQVRPNAPVGEPSGAPTLRSLSHPRRSVTADSAKPVATPSASIRTAA
jgi:hypothetical protein